LVVFSFALQVAGLMALMFHSHSALVSGVIVFAAGSGLTTLARPYWVLQKYGAQHAGFANGVIARAQQLARAAGPVSAAALAESRGYGLVFALLSGLLVFASFVSIQRPKTRLRLW
jgi:predicted MFS family arabinose efflux permease